MRLHNDENQFEKGSFDAISIGGSHRAADVLMDALSAWRILKPGGTMIFEDYEWGRNCAPAERPGPAIDLFLETVGARAASLHRGYQVIIRKLNRSADRRQRTCRFRRLTPGHGRA
jgi:hypothetical protein